MKGFFSSFLPIFKRFRRYLLEIIILLCALIITLTSIIIYVKNSQILEEDLGSQAKIEPLASSKLSNKIFVDLAGAVKKSGLYQMDFGARLKDVIDKGEGLSDEADTSFFQRNFNLSQVVTDQEKIYIPSIQEINNGSFIENQKILDYTSPNKNVTPMDSKININAATVEELDQLPGIGQIIANKIIGGRPYTAIDDLLIKKIVNKSVFEKIKSQINL